MPRIKTEGALLRASVLMRVLTAIFLRDIFLATVALGVALALTGASFARNPSASTCVSFAEAGKHLGANECVSGTVLHVESGGDGATFLNFCKDAKACPFTVVVFPGDRKKMGDMQQLEGQQIEIKGTIQDYNGRAEIVLRRSQQLGEAAFRLYPAVPTEYDVERGGHTARGSTHAKAPKKTHTKQGEPVPIEEAGEP